MANRQSADLDAVLTFENLFQRILDRLLENRPLGTYRLNTPHPQWIEAQSKSQWININLFQC